mgnify:CR=1 FL=1
MKEEIIQKLLGSTSEDDVRLGLIYAWRLFTPFNLNDFETYLRKYITKFPEKSIEYYIEKEVNIILYDKGAVAVFAGYSKPIYSKIIQL